MQALDWRQRASSSSADQLEWADIELKYSGYSAKERSAASRLAGMDDFELPETIDYAALTALSIEARQKLGIGSARSLGQAGRIPGVSPSDLQALVLAVNNDIGIGKGLFHVKRCARSSVGGSNEHTAVYRTQEVAWRSSHQDERGHVRLPAVHVRQADLVPAIMQPGQAILLLSR